MDFYSQDNNYVQFGKYDFRQIAVYHSRDDKGYDLKQRGCETLNYKKLFDKFHLLDFKASKEITDYEKL